MKGTGAGWDSCLYRIFIIGWILAVVAGVVYTALTQPDGSQIPLYVGLGGMGIFMVLAVGYWLIQIAFLGYGGMKAPDLAQKEDVNNLSILRDWDSLFAAMVTTGGDPEAMQQAARRGNSSLLIWFLWAAAIALCPIAMMLPFGFGLLDWSQVRYAVMLYIGIVIFMSFLTFFLGKRASDAGEALYLAPLGLTLSATPELNLSGIGSRVRGGSAITGRRFNREVEIHLEMGNITTRVHTQSPTFEIVSQNGDLTPSPTAPAFVTEALKGLRKAKRWDSLRITGGAEGIAAIRNAKGKNLWLYDLWLIERILSKMDSSPR